MEVVDYVILGVHFGVTLLIGGFSAWRSKRDSTVGYFLANSNTNWVLIGFSVFMTNIGSIAALGLSGAAAATGIPVIVYELFGVYGILLMGFVYMPVFYKAKVFTAPQYLQKRFGGNRLQVYMSIQTVIMQVLMKLPAEIYAGALVIEVLLKWNRYLSIGIMLAAVTVATLIGGLSTVMVTDTFQGIVMLIGGLILAVICYIRFPSLTGLKTSYFGAMSSEIVNKTLNNSCGQPDPLAFHIIRPASDPNYPWPGTIGGGLIICIAYFAVNQDLLQRCFAAKNMFHAQMGSVLASFLKLTPTFIFLLPGFISRISFPDTVGCVRPETCQDLCHNAGGCSNLAYPLLIKYFAPVAVRGFVLAAILASIMSTLTSVFNSGSTLIVMDIWLKIRPSASEREQMNVGRVVVLVYAALAIAFIPLLDTSEGGQLFNYCQSLAAYLCPPTLIVFTIAILWPRCNEKGAFWSLMAGLVLGMARLIANFVLAAPPCGEIDNRPSFIRDFHYLHYAVCLLLFTGLVCVIVSLATNQDHQLENADLTWSLPCCRQHQKATDTEMETTDNDFLAHSEKAPSENLSFSQTSRQLTFLSWGLGVTSAFLSTGIFIFFW